MWKSNVASRTLTPRPRRMLLALTHSDKPTEPAVPVGIQPATAIRNRMVGVSRARSADRLAPPVSMPPTAMTAATMVPTVNRTTSTRVTSSSTE